MAFIVKDLPGAQAIADTSTVQKHPLGTRVRGYDPVYGESEFIYLKGVASTVVGSCVVYDQRNATTVLTVAASKGACAFSMSANVVSQFGWYCVAGACAGKSATIASGAAVYVTATAGQVDDAVVANQGISGMTSASVDSAGLADFTLMYPSIGAL